MDRSGRRAVGRVRERTALRLEALEQRLLLSANSPLSPTASTLAPPTVDTGKDGKVSVSIYDATNSGAITPANVKVVFGKNDAVSSITLTGSGAMDGLGLVIFGATSVGPITDTRTTPGTVAFIASNSAVSSLSLKSSMSGYDLNGLTLGGIAFPTAIDPLSATGATALYCTGAVPSVTLGGAASGDFWIGGKDPKTLLSNKTFTVSSGGLEGDLVTGSAEGAVAVTGDFTSNISIAGGLGSLTITGGEFSGDLAATGPVGAISVASANAGVATGGKVAGGAVIHVTGADPKTRLSVKSLSATGAISGLDLNLSGGLGAVTAGSWTGGTASAASSGAISLGGDFDTQATFSGPVASLTIKGGDFTGSLTAAGPVGAISVASAIVSGAATGGNISGTAMIDITGADPKTNVALKSLSATGNVTGLDLTLTTGSLGSLAAGGAITGLDMTLSAAGVGSVTAASWTGGATQAVSAGAITLSGDFGAQAAFSGPVVSLTIKGGDFTGSLTAAGPVGAISVASATVSGATAGGNITDTAAVDVTGADPKTKVALKSLSATGSITGLDLTLTTGSLGSLAAGGAVSGLDMTLSGAGVGSITAASWTGGTTKAASAGAIALSGDFGTDATFSGPVASLTIKGGDFTGSLTAAGPVGAISVASATVPGATAGGNIADTAVIDITGAAPKTNVALTSLTASGSITGLALTLTAGSLGSLTAGTWTGGTAQLVSSGTITLSGDFDTLLALTGPLASLTIKGGEFSGSLTAGGAVGPISVASQTVSGKTVGGDVTAGALIKVTGSDPKTGFSVKSLSATGNIAGLNLNLSGGLGSLTAASWTGGTAQANASGAISLSGNFAAPLQLTNGLAKMTIKGGDFNGSISAGGEVGAISVSPWQTAPTTPPAGGNMNGSASIIVIGEGPASHLSLDSLTVAGVITSLNVNLSGGLGTLTAGSWLGGTAQAASSGAVTVNGNFTGHLVLTGDLASVTIKGGEFEGSISAGGSVGAIAVSSNTVNNVTQGGDLLGAQITVTGQDPVTGQSVASLSATGHVTTSTLTLSGGLGSFSAGDGLSQDTIHAASLGAVTITGDVDIYSQLVLTGGMASLTVTGGDLDGTLSAGGPVGNISVSPSKGKTTSGGAVNSAQICVTGADPATGLSIASVSVTGQIYSLTANLSGGLGALTAGSWVGGTAKAAFAGAITLNGDFSTQVTLTGSLGSLTIKGGDFTGSATVGGAVGAVSISSQTAAGKTVGGNIASGAVVAINGVDQKTGLCLGSLTVTGSITDLNLNTSYGVGPVIAGSLSNCNVTAAYAQGITISGDMTNSNFLLNGQDSQGDSLGAADVKGWFQDCNVIATSTIVSLSAGGSNGSTVYAGIAPGTTGFVSSASAVVSQASILSLTITGAVKNPGQGSLINSDIAACSFSTVNLLGTIAWDNGGTPFGLSAEYIYDLSYREPFAGLLMHTTDVTGSISWEDANIMILS